MHTLPDPAPEALASSRALSTLIRREIETAGGAIPFSRYMELALYQPQYGYYSGGAHKIGSGGDFVTAPVLTPLFARALARQIEALLPQTGGTVYEFGAGTGALAAELLNSLAGSLKRYCIIEVSPNLAQRQREHIAAHAPEHAAKVNHLSTLPDRFDGIIIGNEVLDAMPIERIVQSADGSLKRGFVAIDGAGFAHTERELAADSPLTAAARQYFHPALPYCSELHPAQHAFVRTLAQKLERGAMIWIDYGFDAAQYYHPQRDDGTLIGHYCHHTVHDPFFLPGLTDLTAHVNFTDIAEAGCSTGLDLIGYANQAAFLLNLGITELLAEHYPEPESPAYLKAAAAVHTLTAAHEMGELFKVIAFGKHIDPDWQGFVFGDSCHRL